MKKYKVYIDGYVITGQSQEARLFGECEAESFEDAVRKLCTEKGVKIDEERRDGKLSSWGCRYCETYEECDYKDNSWFMP